jgi:hypothetical protein
MLPFERKTYQFPDAEVTYTARFSYSLGRPVPKLHVRAIDEYRYRRELSVAFRPKSGETSESMWVGRVRRQPGRVAMAKLDGATASRFVAWFLELCDNYPQLLFNESDPSTGRPCCVGFVQLTERLQDEPTFEATILP